MNPKTSPYPHSNPTYYPGVGGVEGVGGRGKMFKKMHKEMHPNIYYHPPPQKKIGFQQILAKFGPKSHAFTTMTSTTLNIVQHNADKHSCLKSVILSKVAMSGGGGKHPMSSDTPCQQPKFHTPPHCSHPT